MGFAPQGVIDKLKKGDGERSNSMVKSIMRHLVVLRQISMMKHTFNDYTAVEATASVVCITYRHKHKFYTGYLSIIGKVVGYFRELLPYYGRPLVFKVYSAGFKSCYCAGL